MTDAERLDKRAEEALLNGDSTILSFINEIANDSWVKDMINMYSLAFYGFNNYTNSKMLSVDGKTSTRIYEDFASFITSKIGAKNTKAFHINSENWLIDKLNRYKEGDMAAVRDLPDLVIVPDDIFFKDELNQLIADFGSNGIPTLPIRIRYVSTKIQDDDDILYMGDIVRLNSETNRLSLDVTDNKDFENAITQLGYDMGHAKTSKLATCYKKKCDNLGEILDSEYGRSPLEDTALFTKDTSGRFIPVNMSFYDLRKLVEDGTVVFNQNESVYNLTKSEIDKVQRKTNAVLSEIMELYKRKDPYTYNHITGMLELIPIINDGLEQKLTPGEIEELQRMVVLHDVGKLAIPIEVLASRDRLSESEFKVMQEHVNLNNIVVMKNSFINSSFDKALMHHSYDVEEEQKKKATPSHKGYSDTKYKTKEIGKLTSILSTLDIYNAITAERSYKGAETPEFGIQEMDKNVARGQIKQEYLDALEQGLINAGLIGSRRMSV